MSQIQFKSDDTSLWSPGYGNGSDGALTISVDGTDSTPLTTVTGTINSYTGTLGSATGFAIGQAVFIAQSQGTGVGTHQLNYIVNLIGTTATFLLPLVISFVTGAQIIVLKQYSSVTVNSGITLSGQSWNGSTGGILPILCNGTTSIAGTLQGTGIGFRGGGGDDVSPASYQGEGTLGVGARSGSANGNGGGGSTGGGGGGGGHATSGSAGATQAGTGGGTAGLSNLTNMVFGGGGGGGKDASAASGGIGGGFVIIITKILTVTGAITFGGNNGGNANAAGGGAAGGSVLMKFQTGTLGTNLITANGGSGGSGGYSRGGDGGVGRIHADYGISFTGETTPTLDSTLDQKLSLVYGGGIF